MPNGSCCMRHAFAVPYDLPSWSRVCEQVFIRIGLCGLDVMLV